MLRRVPKHGRRYDAVFYVPAVTPLLVPDGGPSIGGAETQAFLVARALAARGVKVCLIAFEAPTGTVPARVDGVEISVRRPYRGGRGPLGLLPEAVAIVRALAAVDADVVVTRVAAPHVGVVGVFSKVRRRRFVYSSAHVSDFDPGLIERKRRNRALYRLGLRLTDRVVVQTDEQARMCRTSFGLSPVVIRNVAETAPVRAARPEAFLWVARSAWYKRPLEYVQLARSLPEAKFWMVAFTHQTPAEKELLAVTRREASTVRNLELLETRPRAELMELVERAVAIVNTSDFEGMPNATLEGWARGVPALTLNHDPDGIIERHGLGEFSHGSRERFVASAKKLWEGRDDQADVAERCHRYIAEEHSEDVVAERWLAALGFTDPAPAARPIAAEVS